MALRSSYLSHASQLTKMGLPTPPSSQITWVGGDSVDSGESTCRTSAEDSGHGTQSQENGLTVTFQDVGIEVHGLGQDYGSTVASVVTNLIPSFGKGPESTRVRSPKTLTASQRTLLLTCVVTAHPSRCLWPGSAWRDGECPVLYALHINVANTTWQLLVLGRPGSGCTSLLKVISNMRDEFYKVEGDVRYGDLGANQARQFRQTISMNTEGKS